MQWNTGGVEGWKSARHDWQLEALRGEFSEFSGEVSGAGRQDVAVLVDPAGQNALAVRALLKPRTYTQPQILWISLSRHKYTVGVVPEILKLFPLDRLLKLLKLSCLIH